MFWLHVFGNWSWFIICWRCRTFANNSLFTEYCERYAKPEDVGAALEEKSSDEELSEDDYASSDEAIAGEADL